LNNKPPVRIRSNVESYNDPYIDDESLEENTICKKCGSAYFSSRWYIKDQIPPGKSENHEQHSTICPACRKQRDRVPGGIIKLSGKFIESHKDEILNLIRNESGKAQDVNPLERIMDMSMVGDKIEITTTNEKLAQRIGKALYKAYRGHIEYKFSEDTKLARINWHREI
jgi:hypothetical protein